VCASTFSPSCNYNNKTLLICGKVGDVPTVKETCSLSCTAQPGADICTFDPCACAKVGDVCGYSLDSTCGYEKTSVYTCGGNKMLPTKKDSCPTTTICLETTSGPTCTPQDCVCKDDGSHCGSTFIPACKLQTNSLYKCTKGVLPSSVTDCTPGICSANVVAGLAVFRAMADDTCLDQCACKEANVPICASAFDPICNYGIKSLMACGNAGDVPTVKEACTLSCTKQPGPDICTFDACACTKTGDACGSTLPKNCGYETNSVYTCSAVKAFPQKKIVCESSKVCLEIPTGPTCTPPDCVCKDDGSHCGSTFVDACNLQKNSLYKCTPGGLPSLVKDCGTGTCSANVVKGTAAFRATADDTCLDLCACKEANVPVCASAFDPTCNYDPKQLMDCGQAGNVPAAKEMCTLSCSKQPGPDKCTFDSCACTKAGSFCGSALPSDCGYEANTLYTCKPTALPTIAKNCYPGICSANTTATSAQPGATGLDICIGPCACKQAGVTICASEFDASCGYDKKALMECGSIADIPKVKEACTLACDAIADPDVCALDTCACTMAGDLCGSALPDSCGYKKDTVYGCGANKTLPTSIKDCTTVGVCFSTPSGPTCSPPDCICKDDGSHCGSTFIDTCNLQKNSLYKCTKGGLPSLIKDCGTSTCSANIIRATAAFRATSNDMCIDQCACKEARVPVCASTFDPICGYKDKDLMVCTDAGDVPTVLETCTQSCTKQSGPDLCALDSCACTNAGDSCGSAFPASCPYEANSLYSCSANKALPVKKETCPTGDVCLVTPHGSMCTSPNCICKDDSTHCGSTFSAACALQSDTLYKCVNGQLMTVVKDCAQGGGVCSANIVRDTGDTHGGMDTDICVDKCACKEAGVSVCGSTFDASCNHDSNALLICRAIGHVPTIQEDCTSSCEVKIGSDACASDPCACSIAGDTCGSAFPAQCGYEGQIVYTCKTNRSLPQKKAACVDSGICLGAPGVAHCLATDCLCKDDQFHCGSAFTPTCALQKNILYKCTKGVLPVASKDCAPGTCSANAVDPPNSFKAIPNYCIDKCKCNSANQDVCASEFDPSCGFGHKDLMECKDIDTAPTFKENCRLSCTVQTKSDVCAFDPCACTKAGDTCGGGFPVTCSYDIHSRFSCSGNKALPVVKETCLIRDVCLILPTGSVCTPPDCVCTDDGSHCGSTFVPSCNLQNNTLYKCTNGQLPTVVKDCGTTTCSANVAAGMATFTPIGEDRCLDLNLCACKEANGPVCASTFDPSCGYGDKASMECGKAGDLPTVKETCSSSCTQQLGPDVCNLSLCTCTEAGDTCGSAFPDTCNFEKDSQYTCSGIKALPVKKNSCPAASGCLVTPTGSVCTSAACVCKDDLSHCGSTFAASCNLKSDTLYKCTNGQLSTLVKDCAPGICSANAVSGTATFSAMADDICLDQCACKEANVPVCASAFDPVCNYGTKSLMACGNAGDVPTVKEVCTSSCTKQPGPDICTSDACACSKAGDTCGSSFPTSCSYEATSIYACSAEKTLPTKKSACPTSNVCLETTTAPVCTPPDCTCKDNVNMCGSVFATACGLKSNTLYKCVKGALPTVIADCGAGTCSANVVKGNSVAGFSAMADDICIDQCACKEAGVSVCAATFPPTCLYDSKSLMNCEKVGSVPTAKEGCSSSCLVLPGSDFCSPDTCACTTVGDVCGTVFPASCNYKTTTVYNCPAINAIPVKKQNCLGNAICFWQPTGPKCTLPECICKDDALHCGSSFFGACNMASRSLFSCVNGTLPTLTSDCSPGLCSGNIVSDAFTENIGANGTTFGSSTDKQILDSVTEAVDDNVIIPHPAYKRVSNSRPTADEFCVGECACRESDALVCGSSFDAICKHDASALMSCNDVGDMPVLTSVCSKGCKQASTGAECLPDPCACTKAGDTCGSSLPTNCAYEADAVYSCVGVGAAPEKKLACTGGATCLEVAVGPTCSPSNCICKDDGFHCGSQFPASCAFPTNTLYKCTVGSAPTVSKDCGDGKCSANIRLSGTVTFKATGDDICVDKCACQEASVPICAFSFPAVCNYNNKTLMNCGKQGDVPVVSETCTGYCDVTTNAPDVCAFNPCACRRVGDTCGKSFPAECGYLPDTVYTCATNRTLPVKKAACQSSEICQSVPGGSDVCVASKVCDCVGTGTVCTERFPADCAKPANSVVTCPAGTVTACPDGCAAGECKTAGCLCADDNVKCGSSFAIACNLIPSALYTCVSGERPVLKADCGALACVRSTSNAMCQDPCKCRGTNAVCGSSFPASCGLSSNTVFSCTTLGATPVPASICAAGCYASNPDASCMIGCAATVVAATTQIDKVVSAMGALVSSSNITVVVYPPLVSMLNEVKADLTTAKDDAVALAKIAATANKTIDSVLQLFKTIQTDFLPFNFTTSVALNNSLPDLPTLMQKVATCVNSTTAECAGTIALFKNIANAAVAKATALAVGTRATSLAPVVTSLKTINTALEMTLTAGDTATLRATGQTFGALIGTTAGNVAKYGNVSDSLLLMYDAFSEALRCKGVNSTLFADKCAMYRDRLSGVLGDFIQFLQDNLGALPVIGPLIVSPLMSSLKALVIDLQQGSATSISDMIALFYGILQVVNIVSPADQTNPIRDYLLRLVGLLNVPSECGGGGSPCSGLIKIVRMMTDAVVTLIKAIPLVGFAIGSALNPLLDGLLKALTLGSSTAISASYALLSGSLKVVEVLPFFGNIATPFRHLLEAIKKLVDCLSVGTVTNTATKLELSDGVEEVELRLPGIEELQQQRPLLIEQPEIMLAEI
ncbi:MAG: hypothetical protein J3R72DRAFT_450980, partial [Linnemannia gamsii]